MHIDFMIFGSRSNVVGNTENFYFWVLNIFNVIKLRSLLSLLLPEFILENFELKSARKEEDVLHIDLEEINSVPAVFEKDKLESKGFFPTITVQDFFMRGH